MLRCKDIANLLIWVLWECLIMSIDNDSITLYQQLAGNIDVYLCAKNQLHLTSFLRYCKYITNLLFWKLCECFLTIPIKNERINLWENVILICFHVYLHAKNQLHPHVFLEILQRYTNIYSKNTLHNSLLFWNTTFENPWDMRILQCDRLTALWSITPETEFLHIWNWWWNMNFFSFNSFSIVFNLLDLQKKLVKKFLKNSKKTVLGPFWALFFLKFGQKWQTVFSFHRFIWVVLTLTYNVYFILIFILYNYLPRINKDILFW